MEQRYKLDFSIIGKRIASGRKALGITQKELAERVHITTNQTGCFAKYIKGYF